MSEIVNLKAAFDSKPDVFGTAVIPMGQKDLEEYGAGTPVTHWFVIGFVDVELGNCIECHAANAAGYGVPDAPDYHIYGIRWTPGAEFRRVLSQICSPEGLDELIKD